ncbi:hypothetical protein SLA2020_270260 [Shorea laevis]
MDTIFTFFKLAPNPNFSVNLSLCVSHLIVSTSRHWILSNLIQEFDSITVEHILKIHIPLASPSNEWFWAPNSSGLFSVTSAYDIAADLASLPSGPLSSIDWKCLWKLKLQHRLKHLLWKVAWNILPTRMNIFKFKSSASLEDKVCPICNGPSESTQHIFFECILAKAIWRSSNGQWTFLCLLLYLLHLGFMLSCTPVLALGSLQLI